MRRGLNSVAKTCVVPPGLRSNPDATLGLRPELNHSAVPRLRDVARPHDSRQNAGATVSRRERARLP